eukprot:1033875-Rhodomonas_salina.2
MLPSRRRAQGYSPSYCSTTHSEGGSPVSTTRDISTGHCKARTAIQTHWYASWYADTPACVGA